jgi:serine/threonine protein kinase
MNQVLRDSWHVILRLQGGAMSFLREPNAEPIVGYRLIAPLGSGGFGEVWKCEAPGGIFKAMKFVFGNLNSLDVDGARAEQELHALNRIREVRHPFVLSLDRIEVVEGELVIVMELADRSLYDTYQDCLAAGLVGIPRDALLRYIRDAAEALDHMNEKHNLQHLDIKPRNLFLVSDRVKVADFGLVKHLERSGVSGLGGVTPLYAPPETFSGNISGRSDQYSLAIVYQELLTGQRPFNGKNPRALAQQHLHEEPDLRALPQAERAILGRALAKDPAKRFPNCLAFLRALYTANLQTKPEVILEDSNDGRPKSLSDTMENIALEQLPDDRLVPVDLGSAALEALVHSTASRGVESGNADSHAPEDASVSRMGVTFPQPTTGALRPTLLIGVGSFGRRALLELRCRLIDRFGDFDRLPLLRFLYIDTDPEAVKAAVRGQHDVALRSTEVYHLALQPVSHYRRRHLDQLNDWLPREKLFALPRSLKTQGSRALGRLAFTDNYLRLLARLRRELLTACHPDTIYTTVSETGLALRDNVPRTYVIGCASGGGSGYLADLGFTLRRMLHQMQQSGAPLTGFLFCGAPEDPATPRDEQANLYATLMELNHFSDPAITFTAQYGADGPRLKEEGEPFDSLYLLTQRYRTPECRRDALAHLGSYLYHELTTPLGLRLDRARSRDGKKGSATYSVALGGRGFRSLGTYGIWFPRGLLLRLAARGACVRLLAEWEAAAQDGRSATMLGSGLAREVETATAHILADAELQPEALAARIGELSYTHLDGTPREVLTHLLSGIEEQVTQSVAQDDPAGWARQALSRVQDWLGGGLPPPGVTTMQQRKSRLTRALEAAALKLAEEWEHRFSGVITGLLEQPGLRLAAGETGLQRFMAYCEEAASAQSARCQQQAARSQQAQDALQQALTGCIEGAGSFSWFGTRSRRTLRSFVDHLAAFARQCLAEDTSAAVLQFYASLRGRLADRLRDLTFCRQRLRHLRQSLEHLYPCDGDEVSEHSEAAPGQGRKAAAPLYWAPSASRAMALDVATTSGPTPIVTTESFWESIRETETMRVVLPPETRDLDEAARRFLQTLTPENWAQLEQAFQDHVLAPRGGLNHACTSTTDLDRHLLAPLLSKAMACLSALLPITDVAELEFAHEGDPAARIRSYHDHATPLLTPVAAHATQTASVQDESSRSAVAVSAPTAGRDVQANPGKPDRRDHCYLLLPAGDAGKHLGEVAQKALPDVQTVNAPGQSDLMFCREQEGLQLHDLESLLGACRPAYREASTLPPCSPHSRFDILDWIPLDP